MSLPEANWAPWWGFPLPEQGLAEGTDREATGSDLRQSKGGWGGEPVAGSGQLQHHSVHQLRGGGRSQLLRGQRPPSHIREGPSHGSAQLLPVWSHSHGLNSPKVGLVQGADVWAPAAGGGRDVRTAHYLCRRFYRMGSRVLVQWGTEDGISLELLPGA